jgi:hypothetical protein
VFSSVLLQLLHSARYSQQVLPTPPVCCNHIPLRVKDGEHQPRSDVSALVREQKTYNHMSQPSACIHLDHTVIRTFRTSVKVGCRPTIVDVRRFFVLVIRSDVGWADADELNDPIPPISGTHRSTHWVVVDGYPNSMATSWSVIVISPHDRWKVWVSECHRLISVINVAKSMIDNPLLISLDSGRKWARRMNGVYYSSH